MHHCTIAFLFPLSSLSSSHATPHALLTRNTDQSDGKCSNGEDPPCTDSHLCFYDYALFVGNPRNQGGKPNWVYCDAAIDIVCSTKADCYAQASNGDGATSKLRTGTSEGQGPSERSNEGKATRPLATASNITTADRSVLLVERAEVRVLEDECI